MGETRSVELSDEQIEFLRTSLDYTAMNFREADYSPDPQFGRTRREEADEMIASIRTALSQASPVKAG